MFKKFKQKAEAVIECQNGLFHRVLQQIPYAMVFKTTNWCWNNCAHCCENSGIHNPHTFIPEYVIKDYLHQAASDKSFGKAVVFTGGEAMSAYKFAGEKYIPNIINAAREHGIGVDIKTNAGWVKGGFSERIFKDIEKIIRDEAPKEKQSFKNVVPLQVSLSLDKFHKDSIQRDFAFIKHFADLDIPGVALLVYISSFEQDKSMFNELFDNLRNSGVKIDELAAFDKKRGFLNKMYSLNGNVVVKTGCGTLFNGGRAVDIDWAYNTPYPQFVFVSHSSESLMAFDSFGNVTLGENSGKKISTPWRDKNGNPLSLQTIRENLIAETKKAEQEFLSEHKIMNAYFMWIRKKIARIESKEKQHSK